MDQFYDTFLDRVSQGRGMSKEDVDAVGRGRVWMGQQAIEKRLIDHLGGLREALEAARAAGNLPDDAPILEVPRAEESLIEKVLKIATGGGAAIASRPQRRQLPAPIRSLARALAPLVVYRSDEPLARMEWVDAGDSGSESMTSRHPGAPGVSLPPLGEQLAEAEKGQRRSSYSGGCGQPSESKRSPDVTNALPYEAHAARSTRMATSGGTPRRIGGPVVPSPA